MSRSVNLFEDALTGPRAFTSNSEYKRLEGLCYTTQIIKIPSVNLTSINTWFVRFDQLLIPTERIVRVSNS